MSHGMGQEGMAPLPPPPMPPPMGTTGSWMHFATPFPTSAGPVQEVPMNNPSPAESKLKEVMGILKKNETELPAEVAAVMKDTKVHEGMQKIQGMHEAVENLGDAQQRLEQVCFAQAQNLASWRQFLHLSVQRWQEYTQRFQNQEKNNLEQIAKARDDVKKAQAIFRELQDRGVITIEAEDDPAMKDDVLMNMESSKKIEDGLTHLTTSLGEFAQQADQEHAAAEEQQKKRQKKEESTEAAPAGSKPLASPSMQPFGGAHSG